MVEHLSALVVDDEPDVCWALQRLLRGEGYTVLAVGSGTEALALLKESAFHVAFIDAKLPDLDGVDLARRIRAETACQARLILISGYFYSDDNLVQECLRSGLFYAFVTKPFNHEGLRRIIRTVLFTGQGPTHVASAP